MKAVQFTLESLFGNPPLPPNTYQLQAPIDIKKTEELFQFIYHIYKEGCIIWDTRDVSIIGSHARTSVPYEAIHAFLWYPTTHLDIFKTGCS